MADLMVFYGDAVKSDKDGKVKGYLVRFSLPDSPDIQGDYFTPETDFGFDETKEVGVYFHHGLPVETPKGNFAYRERIGTAKLTRDNFGVYAEAILKKRNEYEEFYYSLIEEGKAGWSSGAAAHLVDRNKGVKANHITRWVIAEASITHVPAEPRNVAMSVKAELPEGAPEGADGKPKRHAGQSVKKGETTMEKFLEFLDSLTEDEFVELAIELGVDEEELAELGAEFVDEEAKHGSHNQKRHGWRYNSNMSKKIKGKRERAEYLSRLRARRKQAKQAKSLEGEAVNEELLARLTALEKAVKQAPPIHATYAAEPARKSVEDFAAALFRRNEARLAEYGVKAVKDLSGQAGSQGGYLIPTTVINQVFQIDPVENEIVKPRATSYRFGSSREIYVNAVRSSVAVTNSSSLYGGIAFSYVNEGATVPQTEPVFEQIKLTAHKLTGSTFATDEILAETANLENALRNLYQGALQHQRDFDYLQGNGAGKPLGVLNSPALVTVTRTTASKIKAADISAMYARFRPINPARACWIISQPAASQLLFMEDALNAPVYMPSFSQALQPGQLPPLLGMPVFVTEKAKPLGTTGDILLVDLSAYATADTGGIEIATSADYKFLNNVTTFRLVYRHDGQPLIKAAIPTMANGSNTTVSPFVALS